MPSGSDLANAQLTASGSAAAPLTAQVSPQASPTSSPSPSPTSFVVCGLGFTVVSNYVVNKGDIVTNGVYTIGGYYLNGVYVPTCQFTVNGTSVVQD